MALLLLVGSFNSESGCGLWGACPDEPAASVAFERGGQSVVLRPRLPELLIGPGTAVPHFGGPNANRLGDSPSEGGGGLKRIPTSHPPPAKSHTRVSCQEPKHSRFWSKMRPNGEEATPIPEIAMGERV